MRAAWLAIFELNDQKDCHVDLLILLLYTYYLLAITEFIFPQKIIFGLNLSSQNVASRRKLFSNKTESPSDVRRGLLNDIWKIIYFLSQKEYYITTPESV